MKCPKCGYVSHDYLDACRKCSIDLVAFKQEISLAVLQPGDLDLALMVGANSTNGNGSEFDIEHNFLGTQMLVETENTEAETEDEVDIRLDDEMASASTETSESEQAPGALTRQFFVPDELTKEFALTRDDATDVTEGQSDTEELSTVAQDPVTEEILNLDTAEETVNTETFFAESVAEAGTDVIDMNELQELRDSFSEAAEAVVETDDVAPEVEAENGPVEAIMQDASQQIDMPADLDVVMDASQQIDMPADLDAMGEAAPHIGEAPMQEMEDSAVHNTAPEAPAETESLPPHDIIPDEPESHITLSLPVDPNTETLFFDELADAASPPPPALEMGSDLEQKPVAEESAQRRPDIAEAPAVDETIASSDQPVSEFVTDDIQEAEVMLDLGLGPEPPAIENRADDDITETPADPDAPESGSSDDKTKS